ncbi:c-type cytochrome [Methylobacterium oryzae CBMB20]
MAGNTSVQSEGPETVLRVIYGGLAAQSGLAPMVAIGQQMTDVEVRNVTDYIRNSWGNKAPVVTGGTRPPRPAPPPRPCWPAPPPAPRSSRTSSRPPSTGSASRRA